jgi:hypothetical protein
MTRFLFFYIIFLQITRLCFCVLKKLLQILLGYNLFNYINMSYLKYSTIQMQKKIIATTKNTKPIK